MLQAELCTVTGFEPQPDALAELQSRAGSLETYLPWAVGDGETHTLRQCWAPGMSSLLEPDRRTLERFNEFRDLGRVEALAEVVTRRLDDISEIEALDFLKIDIQGGELMVFEHGQRKL
jgi:FkbM family methyltransferase